jgi:hypothetical protein
MAYSLVLTSPLLPVILKLRGMMAMEHKGAE